MENTEYERILDQVEYYNRIDSHDNTRRSCLDALRHNPHDEWVLSMLTRAYYELRDFEACVATGKEALAYQTLHRQAFIYNILAAERAYKGDYKKAAEYSQKAVEGRPESGNFLAQHAENLARLGRKSEAMALFKRAEEMEPQNYFVLSAQFQFYHDFYRKREVEEDLLSRMLPLSSKPFDMNWKMGVFHHKYQEYEAAYNYFVQAMLVRPGDEGCRQMLSQLESQGLTRAKRWKKMLLSTLLSVVIVLGLMIGGILIYEYIVANF